jgi:hypothetical protein
VFNRHHHRVDPCESNVVASTARNRRLLRLPLVFEYSYYGRRVRRGLEAEKAVPISCSPSPKVRSRWHTNFIIVCVPQAFHHNERRNVLYVCHDSHCFTFFAVSLSYSIPILTTLGNHFLRFVNRLQAGVATVRGHVAGLSQTLWVSGKLIVKLYDFLF